MILFTTESHRVGVIDDGGRPKLLTPEQFDALIRISGQPPISRGVADADLDELFRANGVCIPRLTVEAAKPEATPDRCEDCGCTDYDHHKLRCEKCGKCNGWRCPVHHLVLCGCTYAGGPEPV